MDHEEGEGPPLLLISHGRYYEKQSLYNVWENRFHTASAAIPLLRLKRIVGCAYGWVVLLGVDEDNCWVWNPISAESIRLPPLEHPSLYTHCILTLPPTQPDCHILLNNPQDFKLACCNIGDDAFTTQDLDDCLLAIGVFRGRTLGLLQENYALVSIDIDFRNKSRVEFSPLFELRNLNISSRPFHATCWSDVFLVSCDDDELFLVRTSKFKTYWDFRVFRVDPDRMECCREVADIGGRTIFLIQSLDVGYCCNSNKVKPNCIYYTAGFLGGRSLYIYNLEDSSTTPLLPSPSLPLSTAIIPSPFGFKTSCGAISFLNLNSFCN